jgi:hypothetical protein
MGIEQRLPDAGWHRHKSDRECWRVERIGPPAAAADIRAEPGATLLRWIERLRDHPGPSPYRIRPIAGSR